MRFEIIGRGDFWGWVKVVGKGDRCLKEDMCVFV